MKLDPEVKNYFDGKFGEFHKKFSHYSAEVERHNKALLEAFRHDLKAMTEQLPTRTEVREIVKEEIAKETAPIYTRLGSVEREVRSINQILNVHERRITRLEHKIA